VVEGRAAPKEAARKETIMSSEYSDEGKLLTKGEVAQLCRVDVRTVDRWLMAGKVGCHRTPSGRVLFRKDDVLKVIARAQTSPPDRER
jgi:excisionase family DNA binding protein